MTARGKLAVVLASAYALSLATLAACGWAVWGTLEEAERDALGPIVASKASLLALIAAMLLVAGAAAAAPLYRRFVAAPLAIAEGTRIIASANPAHRLEPKGSRELQDVAAAINALAEEHQALLHDVEQRIADAQEKLQEEKQRLAALISDLAQSVIVCNDAGRILLYNEQARQLLRSEPSSGLGALAGASLVGLGRSVFAIFERSHISYALEVVQARLRRSEPQPVTSFVTQTGAGQLIRVHVAPVRSKAGGALAAEDGGAAHDEAIAGFILAMEDVTRAVETGSRNDLVLQTLTDSSRRALASIRAAAETLLAYPQMDPDQKLKFIGVIGQEAAAMSETLDRTVREHAATITSEWLLEDMPGHTLVSAARSRIEGTLGIRADLETVDPSVWVRVDSYALVLALANIGRQLRDEFQVRHLSFRLAVAGRLAQLDLAWKGAAVPAEALARWETRPATSSGAGASLPSLEDILERHGGKLWYQVDPSSGGGFFRLLLPTSRHEEPSPRAQAAPRSGRPEYYDFDLFHQAGQTAELDQRALGELAYTVFDTETTGLQPSHGDEIVCIGALRVVNGRLLHHEAFEQFIDPKRPVSPETIRVTGIDPAMLAGQPTIDSVLPQFHRYCADTVLVAHNAAFDMSFLERKEAETGVRFTQPVLDTLLLSSVVQPNLGGGGLESLAQLFGIAVIGRHTALGDAIMTAEIFLKLLPLLGERGILTLRDAREASERSYHARLRY